MVPGQWRLLGEVIGFAIKLGSQVTASSSTCLLCDLGQVT